MEENIFFETQNWFAKLMKDQLYFGRCVVVLKRKCGDLADLTQAEIIDFLNVVKKIEMLFRKTFGATMFNWSCLMNNAYQEDEPKPHVHWHFRPRYDEVVEFAGVTFKDPNFGHHYLRGQENEHIVSDKILKLIKLKLQENL